jgi:quercetin dioxygenase-like cupin family protein
MYFRIVTKRAGTGSKLHYHPNELMTFPLSGKINAMVGKDRRIVRPGTFVHIPPYARHGFTATEDGDLHYLYIKDRTWTLIGSAEDEPLPEQARSANEVARDFAAGTYPGKEKAPEKSKAIVEGLGNCYYPMIESLDAPPASGHCERWVEGAHLAFGFLESPPGYATGPRRAEHELFVYVIQGRLDAAIAGETKQAGPGDVVYVPKGQDYAWTVVGFENARYAGVRSTLRVEAVIDREGAADNWRG